MKKYLGVLLIIVISLVWTTAHAQTTLFPPDSGGQPTCSIGTNPDPTTGNCITEPIIPSPIIPPRTITGTPGVTTTTPSVLSCNGDITLGNYNACCTGNGPYVQGCYMTDKEKCTKGIISCAPTDTAASGTTGGGTQTTGPVNTVQSPYAITYDAAGAPQSSSSTLAQCTAIRFASLLDIMIWVKCVIVVAIIPLIFTLAFVIFLWGVLRFMYASDSKDKDAAKNFIWWGLVGLFVMVSVWGILRILSTTLGLDTTVPLLQTSALDPKKASR